MLACDLHVAESAHNTRLEVLNAEKQNEGRILVGVGGDQHDCYGVPDRYVPAGRQHGGSDSCGLCAGGRGSVASDRRHDQHCGPLFELIASVE